MSLVRKTTSQPCTVSRPDRTDRRVRIDQDLYLRRQTGPGVGTAMAFGFGFNKQKALSSAEKFVQQGKLQNAIAEYEKVLKADPKDLTVSNTLAHLYPRLAPANKPATCSTHLA